MSDAMIAMLVVLVVLVVVALLAVALARLGWLAAQPSARRLPVRHDRRG